MILYSYYLRSAALHFVFNQLGNTQSHKQQDEDHDDIQIQGDRHRNVLSIGESFDKIACVINNVAIKYNSCKTCTDHS
jgi:hypothetical protein